MIDITEFKETYPAVKLNAFSEEEIIKYKDKVPDEIIELWQQEGHSSYADGFLTVVLPDDYFDVFKEWGVEDECFVFMRTAFGSLIYSVGEEIFKLDPHLGELSDSSSASSYFDFMLPYVITQDGGAWIDAYQAYKGKLPALKDNEMLALVPTIEDGGSPETSVLEIVDLSEHHCVLAGQYENYLMENDEQDGEGDMDPDDFNFNDLKMKLAIMGSLDDIGPYEEEAKKVLNSARYTRAYRRAHFGSIVPSVLKYYTNVELKQEHLDQIVNFAPAVYHSCYGYIIYDWGGEEDYFNITKNLKGIEMLRNMEVFDGSEILQESPNISALLDCPSLKKVILGDIELSSTAEKVVEKLRKKGVEVED